MNQEELLKLLERLESEEKEILENKGKEYSGENRLGNFERIATIKRVHPLDVLITYMIKHIDSLVTFSNELETKSEETIYGRINDVRNYALLYAAMVDKYSQLPDDHEWKIR